MTDTAVKDTAYFTNKNKSPNDIKIEIPAQSEYVSVVRLAVSGVASRLGFTVNDIEDIKVAVSEACTNCVQHAYDSQDGRIFISCIPETSGLEIIVEDLGKGFDTNIIGSESQIQSSQEKLGLGLGLTFIKTLMDTHSIDSFVGGGTCIKMKKNLTESS